MLFPSEQIALQYLLSLEGSQIVLTSLDQSRTELVVTIVQTCSFTNKFSESIIPTTMHLRLN